MDPIDSISRSSSAPAQFNIFSRKTDVRNEADKSDNTIIDIVELQTASGEQKKTKGQTEEETQQIRKLERRDAEVRQHEAAHASVGGAYVRGGPSFEYQTGPDGKRYAVGGEVSIDVSPEKDPRATIAKMEVVRAAALAPANPSSQDMAVAAAAAAQVAQASLELAREQGQNNGATQTSSNPDSAQSNTEAPIYSPLDVIA